MLSGDHVLPRITPNISYHPQAGDDPLGDFLRSLDKLDDLRADGGAARPTSTASSSLRDRSDQLRAHHDERFRRCSPPSAGDTTAWAIAERMHWSRPWDDMTGFMRRSAVGEAMAHLRALEIRGVLDHEAGEPAQWRLTDRAGALLDRLSRRA